ncbi:MAG TPA: hypothetical protein PLT09_00170 [Deltaproteobacteria bacterium]|nr:hypothetical protein [Deltaproteobacteria bacterium]HPR54266.1 hypothetical protein [Deltaproteobacteria bacterium]HXK45822.1 hypothetical protein [Deltaproteobacteria bacterium]
MKKIIFSALVLLFIPLVSHGAGYVLADYGSGGEVDGPSYGLEMGGIFLSPYHPNGGAFSVGLGISIADTDENPPASPTRKYNDGNEQEVHATLGAEITPAFFGVAGIGYASQDVVKPGTVSEKDSDTENHVSWMLGMRYVVEWFNLGVGYHSRRGVMAGFGVAF